MSLPRYPEYKDTGVEWIGKIPAHWDPAPLKRHVRLITDRATSRRRAIGLENVEGWSGRLIDTDGDFEGDGVAFEPGDVLFGKLRPYLAKVLAPDFPGEAVGDFHVLRPRGTLLPRYIQYQMLQSTFISVVDGSTFGSKMPRASWEAIGGMLVMVPPSDEQAAIASFLDYETAKIDALIAEQEKLLALLAEKRQATISHAVTRGLDPNAPMKDSGIPWLGEVPAHWQVRSISSISTKITNGYVGPTRDILVDEGVRYLQSLHIKENKIRFDSPYYVRKEWSDDHRKSILETGDVLIVQTGDIGQSAVVSEEFAGCNCHALIIVAPVRSELDGRWLSWVLNSDYGVHSLLSIQTGALHPHLNCGNVKGLYVPLPPLPEQQQIVEHINDVIDRYEALIGNAKSAIALLSERRSALIAAAVTGKIDVRGAVRIEEQAA